MGLLDPRVNYGRSLTTPLDYASTADWEFRPTTTHVTPRSPIPAGWQPPAIDNPKSGGGKRPGGGVADIIGTGLGVLQTGGTLLNLTQSLTGVSSAGLMKQLGQYLGVTEAAVPEALAHEIGHSAAQEVLSMAADPAVTNVGGELLSSGGEVASNLTAEFGADAVADLTTNLAGEAAGAGTGALAGELGGLGAVYGGDAAANAGLLGGSLYAGEGAAAGAAAGAEGAAIGGAAGAGAIAGLLATAAITAYGIGTFGVDDPVHGGRIDFQAGDDGLIEIAGTSGKAWDEKGARTHAQRQVDSLNAWMRAHNLTLDSDWSWGQEQGDNTTERNSLFDRLGFQAGDAFNSANAATEALLGKNYAGWADFSRAMGGTGIPGAPTMTGGYQMSGNDVTNQFNEGVTDLSWANNGYWSPGTTDRWVDLAQRQARGSTEIGGGDMDARAQFLGIPQNFIEQFDFGADPRKAVAWEQNSRPAMTMAEWERLQAANFVGGDSSSSTPVAWLPGMAANPNNAWQMAQNRQWNSAQGLPQGLLGQWEASNA